MLTRSALEELYERLEKPLYNAIYRWIWDAEEAHELVQESFLRLWRMRARVEMNTVEPLVYRIGINLAANRRRAIKRWKMAGLEAVLGRAHRARDAHQEIERDEAQRAVRRAVDSLPERLRRVILLSEFSGLSYREIAEALGIPEGTVGSRRHAAIRQLRLSLGVIEEG